MPYDVEESVEEGHDTDLFNKQGTTHPLPPPAITGRHLSHLLHPFSPALLLSSQLSFNGFSTFHLYCYWKLKLSIYAHESVYSKHFYKFKPSFCFHNVRMK
ncbi:hypothetical protein L6452_19867 [Arctium lappa]|uniref:Uncharacterized protein n=1 Tax=Arctium lappa TaxID=4217 RepID=A0ACB9BB21_ARCLA|nr:hypothetical protein L6452_19867 [Arctium lappa]